MYLTADGKNECRLLDENGLTVCTAGNVADAAEIVTACNAHDKLVAALQMGLADAEKFPLHLRNTKVCEAMRLALSAAGAA
jgi:hypothetical protein